MRRFIITAAFIGMWLVSGAFAALPSAASGAQNQRVTADDVVVNNDCSFPMEIHSYAEAMIHQVYDRNGTLKKTIITTARGRITFTNLDTGESLWTPSVGMSVIKTRADGSTTIGWKGLKTRIVVPGQGKVLADLGRVEWTIKYDGGGNVSSFKLSRSGRQDGVVPAKLCELLG